ncbi:hypothetical protein Hamer_G025647, partial [Homarus americanus]
CLMSLYNRAKVINSLKSAEDQENNLHSYIAFAELINIVEEELASDKINLELKDKLLAHIPARQAHVKGRCNLLVHDTTVGKILSDTFDETTERDAICLAKAAHRDMFDHLPCFEGSFSSDCQDKSVPPVLSCFFAHACSYISPTY